MAASGIVREHGALGPWLKAVRHYAERCGQRILGDKGRLAFVPRPTARDPSRWGREHQER